MIDDYLPDNLRIDNYTIIESLGMGGFARTYLVKNKLGERYVLKELFPQDFVIRNADYSLTVSDRYPENKEFWALSVEGFFKEAKVLGLLNIRTIPKLISTFRAFNTYYIVQEFVEGITLSHFISTFHSLSEHNQQYYVKKLLIELLQTLDLLHRNGILHRDLKPDNILIRSDEIPVLIDFGNVRFQIGGKTYSSRAGTVGFTSPEQWNSGEAQDESSDLYSLAACFYELLFDQNPEDCNNRIINDPSRKFDELSSQYDIKLLNTLEKAFNYGSEKRYKNSREWLNDIQADEEPFIARSDEVMLAACFVGRSPFPKIHSKTIPYSLIEIDGEKISRLHLEVRAYEDKFRLLDHSTNGVWLVKNNQEPIKVKGSITIDSLSYGVYLSDQYYSLKELLNIS